MLSRILPAPIIGALALFFHTLNTFFWFAPIVVFAIIKFFLPIQPISKILNSGLNFFAASWISVNSVIHKATKIIEWDIDIPKNLSKKNWYLVISNHQSWVDILAVQQTFNGKIPFIKFFLKQQLIWVPVLGVAWWALDFPFMRRYTKSYIKKNPHKKGKDFETTKKACEKFKTIPISIMNFAEGTRFTANKHKDQASPYQHLLKPKSGGIGYVLTLMEEVDQVLDITIHYPNDKDFSFWDFLCGKVTKVQLKAQLVDIPSEVRGDYINDSKNRKQVQQWVNQLWLEKDKQLNELIKNK